MSRFEIGQTVYMGRGATMRKMVVARVIDNPLIPIYQYTFEAPHDGFACGEQSIREKADDSDLKLSECFKPDNKEVEVRINTVASAKRTLIECDDFGVGSFFKSTKVFFRPNLVLAKSLVEYANGRLIIHVGAGQGHLVQMLKMRGGRAVGIEPNLSKMDWIQQRISHDRGAVNFDINEMLEGGVNLYKGMIKSLGNKCLIIIARPKVKDFVSETLSIMAEGMEMVYITLDELPFVVNDPYLGEQAQNTKPLKLEGISEDKELIYSIVK